MKTKPSVVIITGNSKRHNYYIKQIESYFDVIQVYAETKFNYVKEFSESNIAGLVSEHFEGRDRSEQQYFGGASPKSSIISLNRGGVNNPEIVQQIIDHKADFVLLFGSGIIKAPILEAYPNRVINLHLGLSPYYRGSGTNFWALVDGKPECVGATIHLAVLKVDAGGILHQVRPENVQREDSIHDMGNKTIISTVKVLPQVVRAYFDETIEPVIQPQLDDKDYRRMDLSGEAINAVYANFDEGMIEDYLKQKPNRDQSYPIVTCF